MFKKILVIFCLITFICHSKNHCDVASEVEAIIYEAFSKQESIMETPNLLKKNYNYILDSTSKGYKDFEEIKDLSEQMNDLLNILIDVPDAHPGLIHKLQKLTNLIEKKFMIFLKKIMKEIQKDEDFKRSANFSNVLEDPAIIRFDHVYRVEPRVADNSHDVFHFKISSRLKGYHNKHRQNFANFINAIAFGVTKIKEGAQGVKHYGNIYEVKILGRGGDKRLFGCMENGVIHFYKYGHHKTKFSCD